MNAKPLPCNSRVRLISVYFWLLLSLAIWGCDDQEDQSHNSSLSLPLLDLSVSSACNDLLDNDEDGLIDFPSDPGCQSAYDIDERDPQTPTLCNDLIDNDNDGLIDFNDPGCVQSDGALEINVQPSPQCSNGIDDDNDGYIDFPIDESCLSPDADDESYILELTACNNLQDDDSDGLIDFPYDPGCASSSDLDETDEIDASMIAQCNDDVDNDQDGYTDMADPQCSTPSDPRERQLDDERIAICSNGIDDDDDGLIDAQEDPGCLGPGAASEEDSETLPACADGLDNDADGYIDYPEDPGCDSLGTLDESSPQIPPACLDGEDNDADGYIDFPLDIGCDSSADHSEQGFCLSSSEVIELQSGQTYRGSSRQGRFIRQGSCGGRGAPELTALYQVNERIRNITFKTQSIAGEEEEGWETTLYARKRCDEEQLEISCHREDVDQVAQNELVINDPPLGPLYLLIDGASGRGGTFELSVEATPIEACQNQLDDDGDGLIDFPYDPGCTSMIDEDEQSPDPLPQCLNGIDDDQDNLVDFPQDIGCQAAFDQDEFDECGQGIPVYNLSIDTQTFIGYSTRQGTSSESVGQCGGVGIEQVLRYDNPGHARLQFELYRTDGINETAYLYARSRVCMSTQDELGCITGEIGSLIEESEEELSPEALRYGRPLTLDLPSVPQSEVYLFVDHGLDGFPFLLNVKRTPLTPLCSDQTDNDEDGFIDAEDPGCAHPNDEDERDPIPAATCADGLDNDIDGWTDYPFDLGCSFHGGTSEEDPIDLPSCSNEIDDNGDGYTDFPYDLGCAARGDNSEANLPALPQCSNLQDDDNDGLIDFPNDPGCVARGDAHEADLIRLPHCFDGLDNDQNGLIDYPFDPGCYAAGDPREQPNQIPSACSDGIDNDQDGYVDLPYDPGCASSGDNSEIDPLITPQCSNEIDDDGNQRIDWPDDPGCLTRADTLEDAQGELRTRCSDGVDNDDDGQIDLMDINCSSRADTSETTEPHEVSLGIEDYQCADMIDNDQDSLVDWPNDPGCSALGDFCENGGYEWCIIDASDPNQPIGSCSDLLTDPEHCGACDQRCSEGVECILGQCEDAPALIRSRLMNCGSSTRPINEFLVGPLQDYPFIIAPGCDPDDSVQALLVTRSGVNGIFLNLSLIQTYLERGGIVITEQSVGPRIYNQIFGVPTFNRPRFGNCGSNIQPQVVHLPTDPLWSLVEHIPPPEVDSGCGDDLHTIPGLMKLGGWDHFTTSIGYRDYGQGRLWLLASDWRDNRPTMTDESRALMAAIIAGGGKERYAQNLPECMDHIDNDHDGYLDLFDSDCVSARDTTEWSMPNQQLPACSDGIDNDDDGLIDFPFDESCASAGDLDETNSQRLEGEPVGTIMIPSQCSDGLDNDGNGLIDWPWDRSCLSRGDRYEDALEIRGDCNNRQDDDEDGRIDFPADPDCLAYSWPYEVSSSRLRLYPHGIALDLGLEAHNFSGQSIGCANQADDDGDGLVDYPADPQCEYPNDQSEFDGEAPLSLISRLSGFTHLSECLDGLDNDQDGDIDLADSGCAGPNDLSAEDELSSMSPACGDEIDNDEDGLIDWPADWDCTARGNDREASCDTSLTLNLSLDDPLTVTPTSTDEEDIELWDEVVSQGCGLKQDAQSGQVLAYYQAEAGAITLTFDQMPSVDDESMIVAIGLQRGCGDQAQTLICQEIDLSDANPQRRSITAPHLLPGQYFVTINDRIEPTWESQSTPVLLPVDPQEYVANDDVTSICWQDGGSDSFDCMGRIKVTWRGEEINLNTALGIHTLRLDDQTMIRYSSDKAHSNLWRLRFWMISPNQDQERISMEIYGNLGMNQRTNVTFGQKILRGTPVPYWWYTDHLEVPVKPPVLSFLVPANGQEASSIESLLNVDQVTLTADNVRLPLTYYLASSYLSLNEVLNAIETDLSLNDGRTVQNVSPEEVTITLSSIDSIP
jgi:hypothetical protein